MASLDVFVNSFAQTLIEGIKSNIRTKKVTEYGAMNASGTMADSLGYKWDGNTLVVFSSEKFFTVLETGRSPGKMAPLDVIEKWFEDKPIAVQEISKKSLAYLIAKKQSVEGSLLYRNGGNSGVISDFINEKYIRENLSNKMLNETIETILNQYLRKDNG
jgi:hypothetical protein